MEFQQTGAIDLWHVKAFALISHRISTTAADPDVSVALRSVRLLDVLSRLAVKLPDRLRGLWSLVGSLSGVSTPVCPSAAENL
jgi:hypothetical protein